MNAHQPHDKPPKDPAADPAMERWMDHLGDAEASAASSDLDDRLLARVREASAPAPLRLATTGDRPARMGVLGWISPARVGVAAAVLLVAAVSLIWIKPASTTTAPTGADPATTIATGDSVDALDEEVDLWMAALDQIDADLSTEIDLLLAETSSLEATLDGSGRLPTFDFGDTL